MPCLFQADPMENVNVAGDGGYQQLKQQLHSDLLDGPWAPAEDAQAAVDVISA